MPGNLVVELKKVVMKNINPISAFVFWPYSPWANTYFLAPVRNENNVHF